MRELTNIGYIKELLNKYNFNFSKGLGQNFITNPHVCPKMVDMSGIDESYAVIEIGTGFGVLTRELAKKAKKVIAIEIDKKLLPVLDETLKDFSNITIINDDILDVNINGLIKKYCGGLKVCVCANLPYYITSPIIMTLLESKVDIEFITAMVQKEVGERLTASFGDRNIGAITYGVRYFSDPEILFKVSKGSFIPIPKVESCVIKMNVKMELPLEIEIEKMMFQLIKFAFMQRRKTILNSLSNGFNMNKEKVTVIIERAGVKSMERPERLTLDDFYRLAQYFTSEKG